MSSSLYCVRSDGHTCRTRPTDLALGDIDIREALHTPRRHLDLLRGRRKRSRGRRPIRRRSYVRMAGGPTRLATKLEVPAFKALPRRPPVDRDCHACGVEGIGDKGPIGRVLFNKRFEEGIF